MSAIDTAITNINAAIVANGNEEITADVLRPLLVELANAVETITGDPVNLTTTVKTNLVAAINSLKTITDGLEGLVIKTGTTDPNVTTDFVPKLGYFYARYLGSTLLSFWQYNGYEWVEIKPNRGYLVSELPTGSIGDTAYVTDADSPTYLGSLTGGGSTVCPVFHNGTEWVSH
jgi:hypothetical protein